MRPFTLVGMLGMLSIVAASPDLGMRQEQADQGRGGRKGGKGHGGRKPGQGQGGRNPGQGQGNQGPGGGQNPKPPSSDQGLDQIPGLGPLSCSLWSIVATDLVQNVILASDGTLSGPGRSAIRLIFHDCFPKACDGSIILADECDQRTENAPLTSICGTLGDKASQYGVGTADTIQLAGGGPALAFKTGRADSQTANPTNQLPGRDDSAETQVSAFQAKGFSVAELVVLIGAHTVGKAGIAGTPMDSTPNKFDNLFYNDTTGGVSAASLNSDLFLARSATTSPSWGKYAANGKEWRTAFTAAMAKLSVMGNDESKLQDCSSVITSALTGSN